MPCPEMILHPEPVKVRPNTTILFSCVAWSYGGLVYKWNKNNDMTLPNINSAVSYKNEALIASDVNTTVYEITVFNVQERDEGHYCCVASNGCGSTTKCAWLEVDSKSWYYIICSECNLWLSKHNYTHNTYTATCVFCITSPIITLQPISKVIRHNERNVSVFEIAATGVGHLYYLWQKYDALNKSWVLLSSTIVNNTSPKLNFSIVTEEDQGVYHCTVINYDGSVISNNATITVYGK